MSGSRAWLCGLLALWLAAPLAAGTLYRCLDAAGRVSYQSQGCGHEKRLTSTVVYRSEPEPPPRPAFYRPEQRMIRQANARSVRRVVTDADRCQQAKLKRADQLERLGLKRTFSQLSQADAQVRAQCRY